MCYMAPSKGMGFSLFVCSYYCIRKITNSKIWQARLSAKYTNIMQCAIGNLTSWNPGYKFTLFGRNSRLQNAKMLNCNRHIRISLHLYTRSNDQMVAVTVPVLVPVPMRFNVIVPLGYSMWNFRAVWFSSEMPICMTLMMAFDCIAVHSFDNCSSCPASIVQSDCFQVND